MIGGNWRAFHRRCNSEDTFEAGKLIVQNGYMIFRRFAILTP